MKILMLLGDRGGCGLYRMIMPSRRLKALGHDVTVTDGIAAAVTHDERGVTWAKQVTPTVAEYDVVVMQRPSSSMLASMVPLIRALGPAVIVELDDDLAGVDPTHGAYAMTHPASNPHENWDHLRHACADATAITVTTPALAKYGPGKTHVLPNFIPASMIQLERHQGLRDVFGYTDDDVVIGWSGHVLAHPNDLQVTRGAVGRICADMPAARFHTVGDGVRVDECLSLTEPFTVTGMVPISDYPFALTTLDVGIVPLADTAFNRCKSYLKGLEYAALGIPFVASPLPEYVRLNEEHGIGLIAQRPRDWTRLLRDLVNDRDMRTELGTKARQRVAEHLTIDTNGWRWVTAYEDVSRVASLHRSVAAIG